MRQYLNREVALKVVKELRATRSKDFIFLSKARESFSYINIELNTWLSTIK